ncbi:hypothetical protein [Mycobacterium paraterrae]|uniref:PE-PGRS family protein n=1 Tax=Mycobacterium paraterrae TaxID=577492 RepID=A0ABY3VIT0_9MYCO|nr:hypothetical protein [Mycobacterium paraterrae]UMB68531.1 hypothetical protein MKK62_19235 [Mycobacterium paraterrae]
MSNRKRNRRYLVGVELAIGAAVIAATVASASAANADSGIDVQLDPFELLFGDTGFNSWTVAADSSLLSSDPVLAADLATSVDDFHTGFSDFSLVPTDPFSVLVTYVDPAAFSDYPDFGGLPVDGIGDLAVGLDYAVYASGLGPVLDPVIGGFFLPIELPYFLEFLFGA